MGQYVFGVSRIRVTRAVSRKMVRIARRHGASFVEAVLPGSGYQRWFSAPNLGAPFDEAVRQAVIADLDRAGVSI